MIVSRRPDTQHPTPSPTVPSSSSGAKDKLGDVELLTNGHPHAAGPPTFTVQEEDPKLVNPLLVGSIGKPQHPPIFDTRSLTADGLPLRRRALAGSECRNAGFRSFRFLLTLNQTENSSRSSAERWRVSRVPGCPKALRV